MSNDDPIKSARDSVALVAEVIKAAGDNPKVREAADNLGNTAVTLTKTINNILVPLAAINFAFDKARDYFSGSFQQDITEKTKAIPPENIVDPKASIAGPTLQGLAFSHEEPDLKEMYLNLLANSMDGRSASLTHPAFVEIIKQLDAAEAHLIGIPLQLIGPAPIIQIRQNLAPGSGHRVLLRHMMDIKNSGTGLPVEIPQVPAMIDNWIRLGLFEVGYDRQLANASLYDWVEKRPEVLRLKESNNEGVKDFELIRGIIFPTDLGKRFAQAIDVREN